MGGRKPLTVPAFWQWLRQVNATEQVTLTVQRNGQMMSLTLPRANS
eukprot:NODE_10620_length_212_cov_125.852761_g10005_i0.p1 GENE.NODE_10620_length_212_cov_125.852761_g10005_i0~~NODE_10620_length_212_cov_125.852761_g10005_i0.p1  ORF type:complete len:56 (+),score=22.46 NODE_10620_length_212_cov_125.852761_g10005_i0:31-168(+)